MTAVEERREAEIGQSRRRKEDHHLITGRTTWTDNLVLAIAEGAAVMRGETPPPREHGVAAE